MSRVTGAFSGRDLRVLATVAWVAAIVAFGGRSLLRPVDEPLIALRAPTGPTDGLELRRGPVTQTLKLPRPLSGRAAVHVPVVVTEVRDQETSTGADIARLSVRVASDSQMLAEREFNLSPGIHELAVSLQQEKAKSDLLTVTVRTISMAPAMSARVFWEPSVESYPEGALMVGPRRREGHIALTLTESYPRIVWEFLRTVRDPRHAAGLFSGLAVGLLLLALPITLRHPPLGVS